MLQRDTWEVPIVDSDRLEAALDQTLADGDDLLSVHGATSSESSSSVWLLVALYAPAFSRMRRMITACLGDGQRVPRSIRLETKPASHELKNRLERLRSSVSLNKSRQSGG